MAMTTDDPNDPATVLRNKIRAQVAPTDPAVDTSTTPGVTPNPLVSSGRTFNAQLDDPLAPPPPPQPAKQGVTDPAFTPAAPVNNNPLFKPGQNITPGVDIPLANPVAPSAPAASSRPTGGNLTDPSFAAQYVAWAGSQPGVNPSVKNDPQYWIGRFTSGAFGNDQDYALKRMMQAEGAPEGAGVAASMPSATSPFTDKVRAMLLDRMGRDTAPVNETDSNIAAPFAAANLTAQREQEMERKALAEHAAATGDTSGSINMGIQQSAERNAVGLGSLKGKLIAKEYADRRADLSDAMNAALASGDRETATTLQMALAQLDAQLRREGYGVNLAEFQQGQNNATVGAAS